jgi:hypothetical protein
LLLCFAKSANPIIMSQKSSSNSTTILIILILIVTFPFWIVIGGLAIGLIAGFFGLFLGLIGGAIGLMAGLIALPFKIIFGIGDWTCNFPSLGNGFVWLALLIFAALVLTRRSRA